MKLCVSDAAALAADRSRRQFPVWWRAGGCSVWRGNHEPDLLPELWILQDGAAGWEQHVNTVTCDHHVITDWGWFSPVQSEQRGPDIWMNPHQTRLGPFSSSPPADFISHSFSVSELQFLFQNVLPDLSGRVLVDVGSRLGAVLYGVRGHHKHTHTRFLSPVFMHVFCRSSASSAQTEELQRPPQAKQTLMNRDKNKINGTENKLH